MTKFEGVTSVIPAFKSNSRVLNKNINYVGNYPLFAYSIFTSRASRLIDKTVFCTDDKELANKAFHFESTVLVMESKDKSTLEFKSDNEWVYLFLYRYVENYGNYPEILVILRPTSPLRLVSVVEEGIGALKGDFSSVRSLEPIREDLEKSYKFNKLGYLTPVFSGLKLKDIHNNQTKFSTSYIANEYVDVIRPEQFLQSGDLYGKKIGGIITQHIVQVKSLEDFSSLQELLERRKEGLL